MVLSSLARASFLHRKDPAKSCIKQQRELSLLVNFLLVSFNIFIQAHVFLNHTRYPHIGTLGLRRSV